MYIYNAKYLFLSTSSQGNNVDSVSHADDDVVYDIDSLYEFLAARGKKSKDNDLFWANRGKRPSSHEVHIRDALSNHPKPNGFIFLVMDVLIILPCTLVFN